MSSNSKVLNKDSNSISSMFDGIAPKYDSINHILSLNIDKLWRKKLGKFIQKSTKHLSRTPEILDIACGTGDSSIALYKRGFNVTGVDISQQMLNIAIRKNEKLNHCKKLQKQVCLPKYIKSSAELLPFKDSSFDAITISFGIRNFNNREECLKQIFRVVKQDGTIGILEFAKPSNCVIRFIYNIYFNNILPFVGGIVSKDKSAYKYFTESVNEFPKFNDFCKELEDVGFKNVSYKKLSFGICVLYSGYKK